MKINLNTLCLGCVCIFIFVCSIKCTGQEIISKSQVINDKVVEYISNSLVKELSIKSKDELRLGASLFSIRLEDFADSFLFNKSTSIVKIIDSLEIISADCCKGNYILKNESSDTVYYNDTISKFIIFTSHICLNWIQVKLFVFNPLLAEKNYLYNYYGSYKSFLFEFNPNNTIKNIYQTVIFGN